MLRRVNTRFFFVNALQGEILPRNAVFYCLQNFSKKIFVNYLAPKNIKKKQKYCMETMDEKFVKPLIFGRSRGVDKVIFGCYNEVAPRKIGVYN